MNIYELNRIHAATSYPARLLTPRHQEHRSTNRAPFQTWSLSAFARQKNCFCMQCKNRQNISAINNALISKQYQHFPSGPDPNDSESHNDVNICSVFQAIMARPPVFVMWKHSPCRSARPTWSNSLWSWAADGSLRRTSTRRSGWSFPPITAWLGILSKRWGHINIL